MAIDNDILAIFQGLINYFLKIDYVMIIFEELENQ